jgi:hypothetical protein
VRRGALFVVAAVGLALGAFVAPAPAQTVGEDSAAGDVITVQFRPEGFVFDAHSGPSGENPSGAVTWVDRFSRFGGPVTCLTVTGNRATIGFENQRDFAEVIKGGLLFVEDNGTPGVGQDNVRGRLIFPMDAAPPTVCPPNTEVYNPLNTVTVGELAVHDAPAFPTSKEQCQNGGWQAFPGFRNQGDCVSFVVTGGRNPPGN